MLTHLLTLEVSASFTHLILCVFILFKLILKKNIFDSESDDVGFDQFVILIIAVILQYNQKPSYQPHY